VQFPAEPDDNTQTVTSRVKSDMGRPGEEEEEEEEEAGWPRERGTGEEIIVPRAPLARRPRHAGIAGVVPPSVSGPTRGRGATPSR
jgi:hypothetical protein